MATIIFLLKRFIAQRLLGLAIVVTLAFTVGVLVAGPIYAEAAREAILSSALRTAPVQIKNVRFAIYGGDEFSYEDADHEVEGSIGALPVRDLVRQGRSTVRLEAAGVTNRPTTTDPARPAQPAQATEPISVPLLFRDGAGEHLRIKGEPPRGAGEIVLHRGIARTLEVDIGDTVTAIGPTGAAAEFVITGTYVAPDPGDAFWFGSRIPFPGPDSTEPSPALLGRGGYLPAARHLGLTTEFAWDAYLALGGLPFERAELIPAQVQVADERLQQAPGLFEIQTTTGLGTLFILVGQRISNLRVPIYLVVVQIGAVTLAVLAGVGALTLTRQSFELAVLRSRGFSRGKLVAAQAIQGVFAAAVAYPLGLLFGLALARLASLSNGPSLPGVLFPVKITGLAQVLGLVGAVAGAVILLLISLPHITRTILEERRLLSRESRPLLARYPVEAFVAPLGIFAFLEVRNRGLLTVSNEGSLDPLVLLAPTLLLFAASFLALRLLLFALRRLDGAIGRVRRLPAYLAGRRLGRSPGTSFATSLLLVLSVGLLIVSTSYRAIVLRNHEDSAHQQVGADWAIQVAAPDQPLVAIEQLPAGATPIVRAEPSFEIGSFRTSPTALAIDPATYANGGWWRDDYSEEPLVGLLRQLRSPAAGEPLPAGTAAVEATIDAPESVEGFLLSASFAEPEGGVTVSEATIRAGPNEYSFDPARGVLLLSLVVEEQGVGGAPEKLTLAIESVRAGGLDVDVAGWQPLAWRGSRGSVGPEEGGGASVRIRPGAGHVLGGIAPPAAPLPAVVSPGIASSQGEIFEAAVGSQLLEFRTVAVADSFPSVVGDFLVTSAPAALARAARIPEAGLGFSEVWAMGGDPRPALESAGFAVGRTQQAAPIVAILSQLPQSLAVGMHFTAATGGLGLVVVGVAVGLYFAQRRREFEFASLRAMGTEPRQISLVLLLEQGSLIGFAVLAGAALGFGIVRLMIPYLGRSLGAIFPPPVMVVDWRSLGLSGAAIVVATGIGLLAAMRALLRSSVTSVLRGEAE